MSVGHQNHRQHRSDHGHLGHILHLLHLNLQRHPILHQHLHHPPSADSDRGSSGRRSLRRLLGHRLRGSGYPELLLLRRRSFGAQPIPAHLRELQ